jgi:hypothetical protein
VRRDSGIPTEASRLGGVPVAWDNSTGLRLRIGEFAGFEVRRGNEGGEWI